MKILIADDSTTQRFILKKILKDYGIPDEYIYQAMDGKDSLDKIKSTKFDLVLMDDNMPNMDGVEAIKNIRGMNNPVPILMITTEGEESKKNEALSVGVSSFVTKPFSPEDLISVIKQYISL